MHSIETKPATSHDKAPKESASLVLGQAIGAAEDKAIDLGTNRIYRLRVRHPYLYGLAAFILGGGFVSVFTMTTYTDWAFESVNLAKAFYQIVLGGLGGGIVTVILAFAYAGSIRKTREAIRSSGISRAPRPNTIL